MRAIVCKEMGPPGSLRLAEIPSPEPGSGEVLIRVEGAGVNFPDSLIIEGKYQVKPALPFVPGFEVAGTVVEIGRGVASFKPGDRIMSLTANTVGGFAEKAIVTAEQAVVIPDGMDGIMAAAFYSSYGTSYHALLERGHLRQGETLVVLGAAGGIGLATIEIGKALGARVIAVASTKEKLDVAKAHGADELVNYRSEDLAQRIKQLTDGKGADVCMDTVGGDAFDSMSRNMNYNGRLLIVGFASGTIPRLAVNLLLLKGYQAVGVFWGPAVARDPEKHRENFRRLGKLYAEGKLNPRMSGVYPLERTAEAIEALLSRRETGKLVVSPLESDGSH